MGVRSERADLATRQARKQQQHREAQSRYRVRNYVTDVHRNTLNAKSRRPVTETAGGVEWSHMPTTKVITGHGFRWAYCESCDDVTLHHVRTGCASAHRHK